MDNTSKEGRIRIELTKEQSERIKQQSGEDVTVLELTVQELEARIAPTLGWGTNHNETLLVE